MMTATHRRGLEGVGPHSAAQLLMTIGDNPERLHSDAAFAKLCGACPRPASSGKTTRIRLDRGGDRRPNKAMFRIVIVRMRYHEPARRDVTRRLAEGKTRREITRCLKRFVAREIFAAIVNPPDEIPTGAQIRAARLDAGISMTDLGKALGVTESRSSAGVVPCARSRSGSNESLASGQSSSGRRSWS